MALIGVAIWKFFYKIKKGLYAWPRMMVVKIKEKKDERHNGSIK